MLFTFTIEGNIATDPELRYTKNGAVTCDLRLIRNSRYRKGDQWVDGRTIAISLSCWGDLAERVAELRKGDTVIAEVGDDLNAESYNGRGYLRATARNVAVSMRWHGAASERSVPPIQHSEVTEIPVTGGYATVQPAEAIAG